MPKQVFLASVDGAHGYSFWPPVYPNRLEIGPLRDQNGFQRGQRNILPKVNLDKLGCLCKMRSLCGAQVNPFQPMGQCNDTSLAPQTYISHLHATMWGRPPKGMRQKWVKSEKSHSPLNAKHAPQHALCVLSMAQYARCVHVYVPLWCKVCNLQCAYPPPPVSNKQSSPQKIRSEQECSLDTPFAVRDNIVKRLTHL